MQDLEVHFRLSHREVDEVIRLISEAAIEIVKLNRESFQKSQIFTIFTVKIKNCLLNQIKFQKTILFFS